MRLEFTYTPDDTREAAMPAIFAGNRRLYRHHWIGISALTFFFTLVVIAVWGIQSELVEPGPPERLLVARETETLLILVGYDDSQYLIPKRAFAGPEGFWRCRELVRSVVPRTQFLAQKPIGFPVLTDSPAPIGALPWVWMVDGSLDSDLPGDDDPARLLNRK